MGRAFPLSDAFGAVDVNVVLPHPHQIWSAEIIRRLETSAWLDDSAALREVITASEITRIRILKRARLLGEERGIIREMAAWRAYSRTAIVTLAGLAFISGFAVAATALGDGSRTVNIIFALITLLGIHCLSLLAWASSLAFAGRPAPGWVGALWIGLTKKLARNHHATLMLETLVGLLGRARLLPWLIGGLAHGLWCFAFLGVLGGLLFMLAFRQYHFNWDTTILPAEFFITLTQSLGRVPHLLGFATPVAPMIGNADAGVQSVWASWLIGCVTVYGLLPRILLALTCLIRSQRGLARLDIDPSLNYYIELRQRIQAAEGTGTVVDPDGGEEDILFTRRRSNAGSGQGALLLGIEIADDLRWPPPLAGTHVEVRKVASGIERKQVLRSLSHAPVAHLLIAIDAQSSPDRGSLRLLADLSAYAVRCKVWLMRENGRGDPQRLGYWQEALGKIGLNAADIIDSEPLALRWLEHVDE